MSGHRHGESFLPAAASGVVSISVFREKRSRPNSIVCPWIPTDYSESLAVGRPIMAAPKLLPNSDSGKLS